MQYEEGAVELSKYRLETAESTYRMAELCYENGGYRDAVNRSYYAAFYALRAVLALEGTDFKRHKDVMGYFNKEYVAKEIFPREIGRKLGTLQKVREKSDYDDFYIASKEKAEEQYETAELVIDVVKEYLAKTA